MRKIVHLGYVILSPDAPLHERQVQHVEHVRLIQVSQVRVRLFETLLRNVRILSTPEHKEFTLVDEAAAVGYLLGRVATRNYLLPLGIPDIVADCLKVQAP